MTRYVQITQSDMDAFMEAVGLEELSVEERGSVGRRPVKERVYESSVIGPMGGRIRVYSSVVGPEARDKGKDAIRVQYWINDRKVYGAKRVNRTENWRANVLERINDVYEMAESGALSRVPKDSRGDYMVARRSRGRRKGNAGYFWGSANYPEIRETRRFAAASVAPFEPKSFMDRVMMTKYLMDDAEKQEVIMKIQYGLKTGILSQEDVLEMLSAESTRDKMTTRERKQAVLSALSNRRWTGRYDAPYEMTSYGIGEAIGKTRTGVEKTAKELIAEGLVVREKRHVREFPKAKIWTYQITPEGQKALNDGLYAAEEEEEREFCNWCKETLSKTRPEERANGEQVCRPCYEAWMEEYRNDLDMHYSPFYAETLVKEAQFKPPASAVANAKRGLKLRKEWGRGGLSPSEAAAQGIDSGVTRAKRIASGTVSTHDVRRMSAFNRHRKNYRPEKKMPDGGPTAGTIAWLLWGGTSGVNWAKKKSAAMDAETFEAYDVASWNPADEPSEEEAVWEQFYEDCSDKDLIAKLWDLEGQPGDSAESWMDSLEGTDEHENVFERHYQLIKEAAYNWWDKMYGAEDEAIKVSPFRKAKVLDIIIDWHQRNQLQSETIAYNLERIHWLLENPDRDWEDYDDLTADDFSAETRPDVVSDGCPVCETELSTVLRCDRCEIAWDLIVDEEGFEYLDSESDDSEDYGVGPTWMKTEAAESFAAESDSDLIYQDSLGEPWVYYPSDMLTQFHRPYLTKMVIPITENNDSFLSNGQKVSISPENNKWYYSDLKSRIEDPLLFKDTPYFGDLDPETEEMNIRRNPITGQDYYTFELEGVIQGVTYDETENVSKALDDWNWSKEGEARQVMEYALGDFLGGYSEKWEPAGGVSVGLLTEGPEGALRHMGHWYPTMVVKKAILRNSLGEVVESYEVDSTNGAVQESIHPEYLHLFDEDYRQYGAEGTPSRDNDRVAVGDRVRSYDFVIGETLLRDDSYIEGTVTKIGEWEYCPCGTDHVFIVVEEVVRQGEKVSATGMDMAFPVITESFITVLDTDVRDSEMLYAQEYYVHSPDEFYGPYYSLEEAEEAVERLMRRGIEIRGITEGQDNWMSESWKTCAMCGEPASFTVEDTPVGPRNFCCERCYAQYMGLPVEEPGYYGLEAEDWNWGGDPDGPLAKALRRVKNNPKKIKPLELVRLPKSDEEVKEAETWDGPFGIETRTPTGSFKKWEKVETYDKLVNKLTEMFEKEGFSPYALDVYAEQMPRVQMTAAGPVVVNDRKVLLATYKYGKWESGPWMAYLPKP